MKSELKHARRKLTIPQPDGTELIRTEGYHEELNSITEELRKSVKTDKSNFIKDLMESVNVVTKRQSRKLTLEIEADDAGNPVRIIKTWTIRKEYYGR